MLAILEVAPSNPLQLSKNYYGDVVGRMMGILYFHLSYSDNNESISKGPGLTLTTQLPHWLQIIACQQRTSTLSFMKSLGLCKWSTKYTK